MMIALKPFLMLASVAFVTGFAGYLAVARITTLPPPAVYTEALTPPASWIPAASVDAANVGKRI